MESLYGNKQAPSSPLKQQQQEDDLQQLEEDIDDDNRDDKEDDKEEEAYVKAKHNGFVTNSELKENCKPFDYYLDSASRSSIGDDNADLENDLDNNVNSIRNSTRRMSKALINNSINNNSNSNGNGIANNNNNNSGSSYQRRQSKNFNYSPDTTDYDSESSMRYIASDFPSIPTINSSVPVDMSGGPITNYARYCTSMPVLEDGLSSGHASDNENNNPVSSNDLQHFYNKRNSSNIAASISTIQKQYQENLVQTTHANNNIFYTSNSISSGGSNSSILGKNSTNTTNSNTITTISTTTTTNNNNNNINNNNNGNVLNNGDIESKTRTVQSPPNYHSYYGMRYDSKETIRYQDDTKETSRFENNNKEINRYGDSNESLINPSGHNIMNNNKIFKNRDPDLESLYTISKSHIEIIYYTNFLYLPPSLISFNVPFFAPIVAVFLKLCANFVSKFYNMIKKCLRNTAPVDC
jgi:hypothetical protein